jgi:microcystin-dependent protein
MSQPYVGEIRLVGFTFAPAGWALCNGALVPISEFDTLFNLLGTTFGGDGQTTFALPDLQGRTPVHQGNGYNMGQTGGVETVTISSQQYPVHTHPFLSSGSSANGVTSPLNNTVGGGVNAYRTENPTVAMNGTMIGTSGGNQPHTNLQPYLVLNWIISNFGVYPSQ